LFRENPKKCMPAKRGTPLTMLPHGQIFINLNENK